MPIVNTGQTANDGTGDTLREAFRLIEQRLNDIIGITEQITWSAGLAVQATPVRQWTVQSGQAYAAASNHTAGASFAADLAAGRWVSVDALALAARLDDLELSAPARNGTGATGTWDISISGSAASAASADNCARSVSAAGLASGGGALTADRTITVTEATPEEAAAGTGAGVMTARRMPQAVAALSSSIGDGQTWQAVTRTSGADNQNTTGRTIVLVVTFNGRSGQVRCGPTVADYVQVSGNTSSISDDSNSRPCHTVPIPPAHYYRITGVINNVKELR